MENSVGINGAGQLPRRLFLRKLGVDEDSRADGIRPLSPSNFWRFFFQPSSQGEHSSRVESAGTANFSSDLRFGVDSSVELEAATTPGLFPPPCPINSSVPNVPVLRCRAPSLDPLPSITFRRTPTAKEREADFSDSIRIAIVSRPLERVMYELTAEGSRHGSRETQGSPAECFSIASICPAPSCSPSTRELLDRAIHSSHRTARHSSVPSTPRTQQREPMEVDEPQAQEQQRKSPLEAVAEELAGDQ